MKVSLILTCAGKGARAGFSKNKLLIPFNGQTVLEKSFNAFYETNLIDEFIITSSTEDYNEVLSIIGDKAKIVIGGNTRSESVKNALKEVSGDIVLIHDGARPFVSKKIILDTISSVKEFGSGIVAIPSADTIFSCSDNVVSNYLGKDGLYLVQTPQGFFTKDIVKAYDLANGISFNDDGEVYKNYIAPVHIVMGDKANVKLTYPADFENLNAIKDFRTGVGFDSHKLVENRPLILGGITIPHVKGLLGHSDADVLTHAIMDAMLSAVALRDIGYHFPDTDPAYKNADSMKLLEKVIGLVMNKGYKIKSLSTVIMAEKPKLNPHIPLITKNLANALSLPLDSVGLGATTLEGLGFVGREEGICVHANCVLESI